MITSEKTEQVSASLFAVHRDLANPKKDSKANTGKFSYTYLSLPALIDYVRPRLKEAQLYVTQEVRGAQGAAEVYTTVWHFSGQFIEFGPTRVPYNGDAQQAGGAITYCRRYALAAVFNLAADEDDDAASAARPSKVRPAAAAPDGVSPTVGGTQSEVGTASDADSVPLGGAGAESATLEGTDERANDEQWQRLEALPSVAGSKTKAVNRINRANHTSYTYESARAGATWAELVKAMA